MALLINQGKQDTSQDNKFTPIEEKSVLAQIFDLAINDRFASTLDVTLRLLNGNHKGRIVVDRVTYDPKSDMSWKYRALRKAAGVPYTETEGAQIDIEALLKNKAVTVDLGIRKGKNKDGVETDYQNVTYKVIKTQTAEATTPVAQQPAEAEPVQEPVAEKVEAATPSTNATSTAPAKSPINLVSEADWD